MCKRAEEAAMKAYPKDRKGVLYNLARKSIQRGYEQAEKDIITLIESRISEILGDAQPKPALRAELQELIKRITKEGRI